MSHQEFHLSCSTQGQVYIRGCQEGHCHINQLCLALQTSAIPSPLLFLIPSLYLVPSFNPFLTQTSACCSSTSSGPLKLHQSEPQWLCLGVLQGQGRPIEQTAGLPFPQNTSSACLEIPAANQKYLLIISRMPSEVWVPLPGPSLASEYIPDLSGKHLWMANSTDAKLVDKEYPMYSLTNFQSFLEPHPFFVRETWSEAKHRALLAQTPLILAQTPLLSPPSPYLFKTQSSTTLCLSASFLLFL